MLELRGITLAYDETVVVESLDLSADDGAVLCLLGPSGCGKSTLLRAIAGLEAPRAGTIHLDGHDLAGLRPDQRQVGLMFQEHALFPHRTVADNVGFGPRVRGLDPDTVQQRTDEALRLVGLAGTEHRRVDQLSGGERQRVALARAVAPRPQLLMLDEPLGSLDRALQTRLLAELPEVFAALGTTVVYVTHDQNEALELADQVAVMRDGRIEQQGPPDRLWRAPRTPFVASFLGLDQQLPVEVDRHEIRTPLGVLPRDTVSEAEDALVTGRTRAVLLPESIRLLGAEEAVPPGHLAVTGTVLRRRFRGDHLQLTVRVTSQGEGADLLTGGAGAAGDGTDATSGGALLLHALALGEAGEPGSEVRLAIDRSGVHLLAPDDRA